MQRQLATTKVTGQREFFDWLAENEFRPKVPLVIRRRTLTDLEFGFAGFPESLRGLLSFRPVVLAEADATSKPGRKAEHGELTIAADWRGETWDLVLNCQAAPVRSNRGYLCRECPPDSRQVFPNRLALWADHLFEPLVCWTNQNLAGATGLALYRNESGSTWASLVPQGANPVTGHLVQEIEFRTSPIMSRLRDRAQ
jgi:hypothetical protein